MVKAFTLIIPTLPGLAAAGKASQYNKIPNSTFQIPKSGDNLDFGIWDLNILKLYEKQ
jgi:hypothetical protein